VLVLGAAVVVAAAVVYTSLRSLRATRSQQTPAAD
jgi:hypothetical protein